MSITSKIMSAGKRFNNENEIKNKIKTCFGANTLNVVLNSFFSVTGFKKKERKILKNNIIFKNKFQGKRCFIIGNGPSVQKMDLSRLKGEVIFTVNQFSKTDLYKELTPTFHMWADERFYNLDENDEGDMEILADMKAARFSDHEPVVFYKTSAKDMIEKYKLSDVLNIHYYCDKMAFDNKYNKKPDMCDLIPWFPTVVHYGIFFAMYMGFSEIYLLGCECTGVLNYIKEKDTNSSGINYAYSYHLNKQEQQSFKSATDNWDSATVFKNHYDVFVYYNWLCKFCNKNHVKLINCTPGGILDILPRMNLIDVLR